MIGNTLVTGGSAVALYLFLAAAPAEAQQGKGKGKGGGQRDAPATEQVDGRYDTDRERDGYGSGRTPPGWCRGVGNPHRDVANCGYGGAGRYRSYEDAHAAFHAYLDRKYSDLARRRPLDPVYQIRIRSDRKLEHDRWHAEMGRRH